MRRFKCVCAYDGTDFSGWQSQVNGHAIQDIIEARLGQLLKTPVRIHASGRTDAGVHARGQVFHFDADWKHGSDALWRAFLSGLPAGIQIVRVTEVSTDFHARFSAVGKRYTYSLYQGYAEPMCARYTWSLRQKIDLDTMRAAADLFVGKHDFIHFCARRNDGSDEGADTHRELTRCNVQQNGLSLKFTVEGEGFLYKMVRSLVGSLVECGRGKLSPPTLQYLLTAPTLETHRPYSIAPAHGLCLEKVFYPT